MDKSSKIVLICMGVAVAVVGLMLATVFRPKQKPATVQVPAAVDVVKPVKGSEKPLPTSTYYMADEAITINLPYGERFVTMVGDKVHPLNNLYITEPRFEQPPRRLTLIGPGSAPHTWKARYYIQEH